MSKTSKLISGETWWIVRRVFWERPEVLRFWSGSSRRLCTVNLQRCFVAGSDSTLTSPPVCFHDDKQTVSTRWSVACQEESSKQWRTVVNGVEFLQESNLRSKKKTFPHHTKFSQKEGNQTQDAAPPHATRIQFCFANKQQKGPFRPKLWVRAPRLDSWFSRLGLHHLRL